MKCEQGFSRKPGDRLPLHSADLGYEV